MAGRKQIPNSEDGSKTNVAEVEKYVDIFDADNFVYSIDVTLPKECVEYIRSYSESAPKIDFTDADAVKKECMESLALMMQKNKGDIRTLAVVRELLDRVIGKPVTPVVSQVSIVDANKPPPNPADVLRKWKFLNAMVENQMKDVTTSAEVTPPSTPG